jgi:TonB family protein
MKAVATKVFLAMMVSMTAAATCCGAARCEEAQPALQSVTKAEAPSTSQYADTAREKVLESWMKNPVALNAKHATTVLFSVMKNGTVSQLSIKTSSGNSHQDYAAIETIIAAGFAPLPSDGPDAISIDVQVGALHKR